MEPVVDLESLLAPISADRPAGRSLAYEPQYDALREARRADDLAPQGDWQRDIKSAAWDEVVALASDCLIRHSKDLQIAAWLTEALAHLYGFAGIRDGLKVLHGLLERFWDDLFPEIEDGDLGWRAAPFDFLNSNTVLPVLVRSVPLTDVLGEKRYSCVRYQESRATDNAARKDPELLDALLAEGKITGEQFDEAVLRTPRPFVEETNADFVSALDALKALDQLLDDRFGREAPSLTGIRKAFEEVRLVLDPILRRKREQEPDAEPPPEDDFEPQHDDPQQAEQPTFAFTRAPRDEDGPRPVRPSSKGIITSAEDAHEQILSAAAYLRQEDPASPVAFLVVRALRIAEVYALGQPPEPAELAAPASTTRQSLKRLVTEGEWARLLEQTEQVLGRPEGRAWLDAHRYALMAMANDSEVDRSAAIAACKALLRGFLQDYPDLPRAELCDDTPTASAETKSWIEAEFMPPRPPEIAADPEPDDEPPPPLPPPTPAREGESSEPDPWTLAVEDVRSGRTSEGIQRLRRAILQAVSGRDRFRHKLQLAELCLLARTPRAALPLLEELARQVDEFRLEQWEDEELCARVWGALYRCLSTLGSDNGTADRLQKVYDRLCRLDINLALSYSTEA